MSRIESSTSTVTSRIAAIAWASLRRRRCSKRSSSMRTAMPALAQVLGGREREPAGHDGRVEAGTSRSAQRELALDRAAVEARSRRAR